MRVKERLEDIFSLNKTKLFVVLFFSFFTLLKDFYIGIYSPKSFLYFFEHIKFVIAYFSELVLKHNWALVPLGLSGLFLFWLAVSAIVVFFIWLLEIFYTDIYNFLVLSSTYTKPPPSDLKLWLKNELKIFKRILIHILVIVPSAVAITLIFVFFLLLNLLRDNLLGYIGNRGNLFPINYFLPFPIYLVYWFVVLSLVFYPFKLTINFFRRERVIREHLSTEEG